MCTNLDELRFITASTTDAASEKEEQCFRQRYGVTARTQTLVMESCWQGVDCQRWGHSTSAIYKTPAPREVMQSVERVESASSCTEFCTCCAEFQNVSTNVSEEPDI